MKRVFNISKLLAITFLLGCIPFQVTAQLDPNARDLIILANWFEGEFDNDSQIWFEGRSGMAEDAPERHGRMHTIHKRIKADFLGDHVFYVEEFLDDDPSKISRQRIVAFSSMAPAEEIKMALYFLRDAKKYVEAYKKEGFFDDLKEEDLFGLDGCHVYFKRMGEQYHGSMREKECQFGEGKLKRYSVHDMVISENQYWRVDRTFLVKNDKFHKGHPNDIPHKMRKVQYYNCDIAFYETAYYAPSEKDKRFDNIRIHNQGGMKWFENPIDGKLYAIQLRDKQYPFYKEGSDFFMMRFREKDVRASKAIIISEPNPKKTGFQMGWASCVCEKEE